MDWSGSLQASDQCVWGQDWQMWPGLGTLEQWGVPWLFVFLMRAAWPGLLKAWSWYPPALFDSLLWYWRQLEWPYMPRATSPSETVTSLELAIDFQASTHVELGRQGGPCTELPAGKRAIFFASASHKLAGTRGPFSTIWLWGYLLPVVFLCVQNFCFLKWFMRFSFRRRSPTWRTLQHWTSSHSLVLWASLCGIQISSLWRKPKRRVRGKQRVWLLPGRRMQCLRELVMTSPWDPGQCHYIPDLTTTQIRRERNRLLHNYDADARFRHRIAPFYGAHGKGDVFLFCEKCHLQAPWKAWGRKWPENRCGG